MFDLHKQVRGSKPQQDQRMPIMLPHKKTPARKSHHHEGASHPPKEGTKLYCTIKCSGRMPLCCVTHGAPLSAGGIYARSIPAAKQPPSRWVLYSSFILFIIFSSCSHHFPMISAFNLYFNRHLPH